MDDGYYNVIPALTIPTVANASSIDHDTVENRIYWTDLSRKSINRAYINGTAIETVIEGNALNCSIKQCQQGTCCDLVQLTLCYPPTK